MLIQDINGLRKQQRHVPCRDHRQDVLRRVLAADFLILETDNAPEDLKDLLGKILVADPARRATIPEIVAHPFFQHRLPVDILAANDASLAEQATQPITYYQSRDDLQQIVEQARQAPNV